MGAGFGTRALLQESEVICGAQHFLYSKMLVIKTGIWWFDVARKKTGADPGQNLRNLVAGNKSCGVARKETGAIRTRRFRVPVFITGTDACSQPGTGIRAGKKTGSLHSVTISRPYVGNKNWIGGFGAARKETGGVSSRQGPRLECWPVPVIKTVVSLEKKLEQILAAAGSDPSFFSDTLLYFHSISRGLRSDPNVSHTTISMTVRPRSERCIRDIDPILGYMQAR